MAKATIDAPEPPLPQLVNLLLELQLTRRSIYIKRAQNEIHIAPSPDARLLERIQDYFDELKYLLPGFCDSCQDWSIRRWEAFWGAHPHFCGSCLQQAVRIFDRENRWPETEIPDSL